MHIYLTVEYGR